MVSTLQLVSPASLNSLALVFDAPITVSPDQSPRTVLAKIWQVYGDPRFVDPAHDDYHLAFGSAAIDHGVDTGVYTDLAGKHAHRSGLRHPRV